MTLVERLRAAAPGTMLSMQVSDLAALREAADEIERLRAALTESYQDNLYNALHAGVTGNLGKWWPGGMSDAEWFCRQAGIPPAPLYTKDELMARVPEIARGMVDHQQ